MTTPRKHSQWTAAAEHVAATIPRERLHPAVRAWAAECSLRTRWAVAFSGGADSLLLLLLLWAHWPERRARFLALHFDHRLRGAESRADAAFCRKVCAALGVRFVAGRWSGEHKDASEADARRARISFFHREARVIWLGHQQDDIAESMLMRLSRGSGTGGLAAPRPIHRIGATHVHLRPLLTLKKAEVAAALRASDVPWREDSTNATDSFFRNRIRRDVLPAWVGAAGRDALAGAARSRELLEEDDAALETWLQQVDPFTTTGALQLEKLAGKPRALLRRAVHRWVRAQPEGSDMARQAFDSLLAAVERGTATRHSLGPTSFAVITRGELRLQRLGARQRKFQRRAN